MRMRYNGQEVKPFVKLLVLRLLMKTGCYKELFSTNFFFDDDIGNAIGLGKIIKKDFNRENTIRSLKRSYNRAEKLADQTSIPVELARNVERLATLIGLTDVDCQILIFCALLRQDSLLIAVTELLGDTLNISQICEILSGTLLTPVGEIRQALSVDGLLVSSGLVSMKRKKYVSDLTTRLSLLTDDFAEQITLDVEDAASLLKNAVTLSSPAMLKISDYEHINDHLMILQPYLKQACAIQKSGVNVFLYGPPGTGKSQLVKVIAAEMGYSLYEIASSDSGGDPIDAYGRIGAYRATQALFKTTQSLIVFDEAEDIFNSASALDSPKSSVHKAWMNKTLEENQMPTFWLSNNVDDIDPAFIRRFDMVIELTPPPKNQRIKIINEACGEYLTANGVSNMAGCEYLAPAVITRAADVVSLIKNDIPKKQAGKAVQMLVNNTLKAQGHKTIKAVANNVGSDVYDPTCVNTNVNLSELAKGISKNKNARICLYGPPGTGKTAFGRWLADQLDMPLHVKQGSDLLSKWLGGTEKNIANAFQQAQADGGLLLLDEVDGFLRDRRGDNRSWEITQVNEMLTQMESFNGVFIASTNLMDGLDQAALRRFDLKLEFGYLKPTQARCLLTQYCSSLGLRKPSEQDYLRVEALPVLTPGDFATVVRQHRFKPFSGSAAVIDGLEAECAVKEGGRKIRIGFV